MIRNSGERKTGTLLEKKAEIIVPTSLRVDASFSMRLTPKLIRDNQYQRQDFF